MSDEKSAVDRIEDKIKKVAKEVEDFADKVAADEQPVVIVSNEDAAPTKPSAGEATKKGS